MPYLERELGKRENTFYLSVFPFEVDYAICVASTVYHILIKMSIII